MPDNMHYALIRSINPSKIRNISPVKLASFKRVLITTCESSLFSSGTISVTGKASQCVQFSVSSRTCLKTLPCPNFSSFILKLLAQQVTNTSSLILSRYLVAKSFNGEINFPIHTGPQSIIRSYAARLLLIFLFPGLNQNTNNR